MAKKLPDLDQLPDEQVLGLLREKAHLSFKEAELFRKRIDRMTEGVYAEAAQLLLHLQGCPDDRSTGRAF